MVHTGALPLRTWPGRSGPIFGAATLWVLTHGDEPGVAGQPAGVSRSPMRRRRANWTFERTRAGVANAVTDLLPDNWDAVIPPDIDEIPFADPALGTPPDLIAAARGRSPP